MKVAKLPENGVAGETVACARPDEFTVGPAFQPVAYPRWRAAPVRKRLSPVPSYKSPLAVKRSMVVYLNVRFRGLNARRVKQIQMATSGHMCIDYHA